MGTKANGLVAHHLERAIRSQTEAFIIDKRLTKQADRFSPRVTLEDLAQDINKTIEETDVKIVFMAAAVPDYIPQAWSPTDSISWPTGKHVPRPRDRSILVYATHNDVKLVERIRRTRKDIFLVGSRQPVTLLSKRCTPRACSCANAPVATLYS